MNFELPHPHYARALLLDLPAGPSHDPWLTRDQTWLEVIIEDRSEQVGFQLAPDAPYVPEIHYRVRIQLSKPGVEDPLCAHTDTLVLTWEGPIPIPEPQTLDALFVSRVTLDIVHRIAEVKTAWGRVYQRTESAIVETLNELCRLERDWESRAYSDISEHYASGPDASTLDLDSTLELFEVRSHIELIQQVANLSVKASRLWTTWRDRASRAEQETA